MIVKRLCIVNSNILFEILSELLKEFSFEITSKNLNDLGKQDFEVKGVLYLFNKNEKKLIKQFRPEQILIINKIPIKIEILISQINIQFLKNCSFIHNTHMYMDNFVLLFYLGNQILET